MRSVAGCQLINETVTVSGKWSFVSCSTPCMKTFPCLATWGWGGGGGVGGEGFSAQFSGMIIFSIESYYGDQFPNV